MNSRDDRVAKRVIKKQEEKGYETCWYGNLKYEAKEILGMDLTQDKVNGVPKSKWKKQVKGKIQEVFEGEFKKKKKVSTKLRFLSAKGVDTYLKDVKNDDARLAIKIRLNMVDHVAENYGERGNCLLCNEQSETTEHLLHCNGLNENNGNDRRCTIKDLQMGRQMEMIVELFKRAENEKRNVIIKNIMVKSEVLHRETFYSKE